MNGARGRRPAVPARLPSACVVCATRRLSLSIVHFRRSRDEGGPASGAAPRAMGPSPIEPGQNGSFPVLSIVHSRRPGMMKAVRAAAPRPVPSGRARIDPAKTVESRRSFVGRLSTSDDRARCSRARRRRPEAALLSRERAFVASRRGLRSGEGLHLRLHRAPHPPICRAIDIWAGRLGRFASGAALSARSGLPFQKLDEPGGSRLASRPRA